MTDEKFYRTNITFSVLSQEPIPDNMDMQDIVTECMEGDFVADYAIDLPGETQELTGKQMADALYAAGSDPGFFMLNDDGEPA